jgi:hypothetical protein
VYRAVLASLLLIACGHPPTGTGSGPAKPGSEPSQLPTGAPLVTPGERMSYRISLQGLELGTYTVGVGEIEDVNGRKAVVVQSHAMTAGVAQMLGGKVDDRFTSWIDIETGRSVRFQVDEYATRSEDIEHTVVELAGREGNVVPVSFHVNDQPAAPEPQQASLPETWDYNAFLVAMRAWEGAPGPAIPMEVFRSRFLWHLDVKIHGRGKIQTELGELPALRIDAHTYKLDRKGGKFPDSDERDFSLWISDDDGRVPLQINAKTDYGDIKMQIVDYQPGTGARLRK